MYLIYKNDIQVYHLRLVKVGRKEVKKILGPALIQVKMILKPVSNLKREDINEGTLDTQLINSP